MSVLSLLAPALTYCIKVLHNRGHLLLPKTVKALYLAKLPLSLLPSHVFPSSCGPPQGGQAHLLMSSYAPDETPAQLVAEAAWLQGAIVASVFYGVALTLSWMCFRSLWVRIRSRGPGYKKDIFFLCYVIFVFACGTIYTVANAQITQLGFINRRNYPGGPAAFEEHNASLPINVTFVLMDWCADVLMIWRCIVVYRNTRFSTFIAIFGTLILLASVVTGLLWVITVSLPAEEANGWMSYDLLFPYLSVSLASTIFISCLTVLRLMYHRSRISGVLGATHGTIYTSFATMIIESASVYSTGHSYPLPWGLELQGLAPLLIIYRVAEGKAWSRGVSQPDAVSTSFRMRPTSTQPTTLASSSHVRSNPINIQVSFDVQKSHEDSLIKSQAEDKEDVCRHVA
ncbi:hypothetical protein ID866_5684 [Astraeus odoratus]|nr:hypothetical protein ID866_5684 [Astraeus odoratus]